jgi:DNA-binding CsgD family transcriptional regulator
VKSPRPVPAPSSSQPTPRSRRKESGRSAATSPDWQQAAQLLADAAVADSMHAMVEVLMRRAHALFAADIVICDRFDEHARQLAYQMYPPPTDKFIAQTLPPFLAFWHQHPFQKDWVSEIPSGRIAFLSDRTSHREFRKTDLWNEVYIHLRARNHIMLGGEIEHNRFFCLSCNRLGRDFESRDRELGRFLQPALTRIFQQHQRRERADRTAAILGQSSAAFAIVDSRGTILELSDGAREIFSGSAGKESRQRLLDAVTAAGRRPGAAGSLTRHVIGNRDAIAIHAPTPGNTLFMFASHPGSTTTNAASLTRREAEILHWIGEAKTNADIAQLLGISTRTVDKHCESLFAKIGVETRLAAALLARR